jgi:hypothetical protein
VDGNPYTKDFDVTFGKGPLSVFASAPVPGLMWARFSGSQYNTSSPYDGDFTTLNGASAADFPAAVGECGGRVAADAITVDETFSTPPYAINVDTSPGTGWNIDDEGFIDMYHTTTSKLPSISRLVPVSRYSSYRPDIPRKGAAFAAGWPDDPSGLGNYSYYTYNIYFNNVNATISVLNVYLSVGANLSSPDVNTTGSMTICISTY